MADLGVLTTIRSGESVPVAFVSIPAIAASGRAGIPQRGRVVPTDAIAPADYLTLLLSTPTDGVITGVLSIAGVPSGERYIVRCYHRDSGNVVAQALTDAAGYYAFFDLDPSKRYMVVAHDKAGTYNAVVRDNVTPTVPA